MIQISNNRMIGGGTFIKASRLEGAVITGNYSSGETFIEADEVIGGEISNNVHRPLPTGGGATDRRVRPTSFRRRLLEGVAINVLSMFLTGQAY